MSKLTLSYSAIIPKRASDLYDSFGVNIMVNAVYEGDRIVIADSVPVAWVHGWEFDGDEVLPALSALAKARDLLLSRGFIIDKPWTLFDDGSFITVGIVRVGDNVA